MPQLFAPSVILTCLMRRCVQLRWLTKYQNVERRFPNALHPNIDCGFLEEEHFYRQIPPEWTSVLFSRVHVALILTSRLISTHAINSQLIWNDNPRLNNLCTHFDSAVGSPQFFVLSFEVDNWNLLHISQWICSYSMRHDCSSECAAGHIAKAFDLPLWYGNAHALACNWLFTSASFLLEFINRSKLNSLIV